MVAHILSIPFPGFLLLIQLVVVAVAWGVTHRHNRRTHVPPQNHYWSQFLFFNGIFFLILSVMHIAFGFQPGLFVGLMQTGYIVAHAMMLVSVAYLARLVAHFIPRLLPHEKRVFLTFLGITLLATFLITVVPPDPVYNANLGVTQFDVGTLNSVLLALMTTVTYVPLAYFIFRTAYQKHGRLKQRSYLLGCGLLMLYVAGPIHNYAIGVTAYLIKDGLTIAAFLLIVLGLVAVPVNAGSHISSETSSRKYTHGNTG